MEMGYSNGPTLIYCAYDVFIYGEKSENSEKSEQKNTVYRYYTLLDHSKWRRLPESEQLVLSLLVTVATDPDTCSASQPGKDFSPHGTGLYGTLISSIYTGCALCWRKCTCSG